MPQIVSPDYLANLYYIYHDPVYRPDDPALVGRYEYTPKNALSSSKRIHSRMFEHVKDICTELELTVKFSATGPTGMTIVDCSCNGACGDDDLECPQGAFLEDFRMYFYCEEDAMAFKLRWL